MGWNVGPNKKSRYDHVLFFSSSEGIRAPHEGVTFATGKNKTRIALVGDSYTFGEDLPYEDTWGSRLDQALGPEVQVLNFGVSGYGIDQAYLRYEKEVRAWKPNIVIFGLISHDVERTMSVYPFLSWPEWNIPFSKPRFIWRDGGLNKLNIPPVAPKDIFTRKSISDLPLLEYDRGYLQDDWQPRLFHFSYLARLFVSRFPRWSATLPAVSEEELMRVNASILRAFVRSADQAGTIPIMVYFPLKAELVRADQHRTSLPLTHGKQVLQQTGMAYTDLTSCLLDVDAADRFTPTHHYTWQGNAAVATCLRDVVSEFVQEDN